MAKHKILVVDDEPDIVETLKFRLEAAGFEVFTAYNGAEALEKAEAELPDLIVLDVMMPVMDGLEACRKLKQDDRFRDIPILMLTAKRTEADEVSGMKSGTDEYMTKPFDPQKLIETINMMLVRGE